MVGTFARLSSGLILADNCEAYLNGWTFDKSGSQTAAGSLISKAHAGGGAFQIDTGSSWPSSAYARFTKSVNLQTGANRVARIFRGPDVVASVMDDFPGSSLDTTKWQYTPGAANVSNSIANLTAGYQIAVQLAYLPAANIYYNAFLRCKVDDGATGGTWQVFWATTFAPPPTKNRWIMLHFNHDGAGHVKLETASPDGTTTTDCGAITSGYHNYEVDWTSGSVVVKRDGSQIGSCTDTSVPAPVAGLQPTLVISCGATSTFRLDSYGYVSGTNVWKASLELGSQLIYDQDVQTENRSLDNGFFDTGWLTITATGTQTVAMKFRNADSDDARSAQCTFDDVILMLDKLITIQGLNNGQKVELYDSGGALKNSVTYSGGANPTIDVSGYITSGSGWAGYFKVYDTDGVTLIFTSATDFVWGGDIYQWASNASVLIAPTGSLRIYKAHSPDTPKSIALTFTLKNRDTDAAISGKLVTFSTSIGTLSVSSGTTDGSGQVSTTLTSDSSHGWAIVKADWAGDGNVAPCRTYAEVAVYDAADVGDVTKGYQLFVHGTEYPFRTGSYKKSTLFQPQDFDVELPEIQATIDGPLEVIIYRRGAKDFVGRVTSIKRTIDNRMVLHGLSNLWKLTRRVANKSYNADPATIIAELLSRYPAGVSQGTLATYGSAIQIAFSYDSLRLAIQRILDATGWEARFNLDDTVDFNQTFGAIQQVTFETGQQNVLIERETDYLDVATRTFLIGNPATAVSDKDDVTQGQAFGLIEKVFMDKNLGVLATLDIENQIILNSLKTPVEKVTSSMIDLAYAANAYDVFDFVTVTDTSSGLSGTYQVVAIRRDMTDKGHAELTLSNIPVSLANLLGSTGRTVKDLSTQN